MPTILTEQIDLSEAQVDSEGRVLRNVVLIRAGTSGNRRHYSEDVLNKSVALFEGVPAYDSHDSRKRTVAETTGWYKNVHFSDGALRADRYFSGTQAGRDVQSIAEDIVSGRAPRSLAGLSINAAGTGKVQRLSDGDALVVESISRATSIDDVGKPAAGGSYTEAATGDELALALLEAMTIEEFTEARPDFIQRLQKEWKTMRDGDAVKAAKADADHATEALQEAQATIAQLNTEREAAVTEAQTARRALALEQALNDPKIKLTALWKTELREKLMDSDPQTWVAQMESYQRLAASSGHKPAVSVSGADQQVSSTSITRVRVDPLVEARKRIAAATSPDELLRIQEHLGR